MVRCIILPAPRSQKQQLPFAEIPLALCSRALRSANCSATHGAKASYGRPEAQQLAHCSRTIRANTPARPAN
eukprot:3037890-Alexandrium_andersonii.AAC.1